jgi:hypothetical protein
MGWIIKMDLGGGMGTIVDVNEQEIIFYFSTRDSAFQPGMAVLFTIKLTSIGLVAVEVAPI